MNKENMIQELETFAKTSTTVRYILDKIMRGDGYEMEDVGELAILLDKAKKGLFSGDMEENDAAISSKKPLPKLYSVHELMENAKPCTVAEDLRREMEENFEPIVQTDILGNTEPPDPRLRDGPDSDEPRD